MYNSQYILFNERIFRYYLTILLVMEYKRYSKVVKNVTPFCMVIKTITDVSRLDHPICT